MQAGLFLMPSHPPERARVNGHWFDLDAIALADKLGDREAWIGEHLQASRRYDPHGVTPNEP